MDQLWVHLTAGTARFQVIKVHCVNNVFLVRPLTSSCRVVLGCSINFFIIIYTKCGNFLHGAPDRGQLMAILFVFPFQIMAPIVVTFSPFLLLMVVYPIPYFCGFTILSLSLCDSLWSCLWCYSDWNRRN